MGPSPSVRHIILISSEYLYSKISFVAHWLCAGGSRWRSWVRFPFLSFGFILICLYACAPYANRAGPTWPARWVLHDRSHRSKCGSHMATRWVPHHKSHGGSPMARPGSPTCQVPPVKRWVLRGSRVGPTWWSLIPTSIGDR